MGDSVGAGLHLPEHQAFPAVHQRRHAASGLPFQQVSSCESGRTTAGGVTALKWVLRRDPDLVVIELGANDGLRGIALSDVERGPAYATLNLLDRSVDGRPPGKRWGGSDSIGGSPRPTGSSLAPAELENR